MSSADTTRCLAACDETMSATITVVGDSSLVTKKMVFDWLRPLIWKTFPQQIAREDRTSFIGSLFVGEVCFAREFCRFLTTKVALVSKDLFVVNLLGKGSKLTGNRVFEIVCFHYDDPNGCFKKKCYKQRELW